MNGQMVRVLPGFFEDEPENLVGLISDSELFSVFFPLQSAHRKGLVEKISNHSLPENYKKPEYMRSRHVIRGEFKGWHIINTKTKKRELVKELSNFQIGLSPWGIWNDTLLVERLVEGWTPEREARRYSPRASM